MVSMRHSDYIMPEKNPPCPLGCSLASRRPGDEEDQAKEDKAMSAAVITLPHLHSTISSFITSRMLQRGGTAMLVATTVR
jgi:hypothetical protein